MKLSVINTVIAREYMTRVKKKSFLFTTFLVPLLFAGAIVAMTLIMTRVKDRSQEVAVIDASGIVMPYLTDEGSNVYHDYSGESVEEMKQHLDDYGMDVLLVVSPLDSLTRTVSMQAYSKKPLGVDFSSMVNAKARQAVEAYRVSTYGIEGLEQILRDVKAEVHTTEYTLDDSGKETVSESSIYMVVSMLLGIFIFMFITMFGGMVMSSVIEEKSSRVIEVLISSAKATELMFGKIIGVALVALTQFLLWIVLTLLILAVVSGLMGRNFLSGGSDPASLVEMAQGMGVPAETMSAAGLDLAAGSTAAAADTLAAARPDPRSVVMTTLLNIPWGQLIAAFFIYFILGYLLYASFYAAIGSAVENEADTQQLQIPITVPLMIAYFIVFFAFRNPDSGVVVWGSMIPFTSPIVMLARIPYGVPTWQLALSVALLFLTFLACAWLSAKIYKAGILVFGKKSSFKDLWNWLKQK